MGEYKRFVVEILEDGRPFIRDYDTEMKDIYAKGYADGMAEMAAVEHDAYTKGYFAGKRDGEMSKRDIPEELRKHLEEALSWLN